MSQSSDRNTEGNPVAQYFELLKGMTGFAQPFQAMAGNTVGNIADQAMASLDPEELERKIRDLQTVLTWVQAQQSAIEMSIKTLQFQRDLLNDLSRGKARVNEELEKLQAVKEAAKDFNPAQWAWQNLQNAFNATGPGTSTAATQSPVTRRAAKRPPSKSAGVKPGVKKR